jgi:hypothetical protein
MEDTMSAGNEAPDTPRFRVDELVRAKPGVRSGFYGDLPIGGWTGRVIAIEAGERPRYVVLWSDATMESVHTIYFERCERDDVEDNRDWLYAEELEADDGIPAAIEPPSLPEWAQHAGDAQLFYIFGLDEDDCIPDIERDSLEKYHAFLSAHLTLPFDARLDPDDDEVHTVVELLPPDDDALAAGRGLNCRLAGQGAGEALYDLYVPVDHPNYHLLEDYCDWIGGASESDYDYIDEDYADEDYDGEPGADETFDPGGVGARAFKETMARLRAGRDILADLPADDEPRQTPVADGDEQSTDADAYEAPQPLRKSDLQIGRNDPCPCGSGKKYKKCCMKHRA